MEKIPKECFVPVLEGYFSVKFQAKHAVRQTLSGGGPHAPCLVHVTKSEGYESNPRRLFQFTTSVS